MNEERLPSRFRFGLFELDTERGELRRSGGLVRLQAKPLRLLALLVASANETVSREDIRRHVWPSDVHVEFDQGINACIKQIRAALGDSAETPRVIETLPREGYRFLLPVQPIDPPPPISHRRWSRVPRLALAAAGVVSLLVLGAVVHERWGSIAEHPASTPVLAVLPFELFGEGREDAFFRDALTDELITQLGRQYGRRLGVIARTSVMRYKGGKERIREIGRALGADYVLEGSVRRLGRKIRVAAQLIRVEDESHVWASAFQRESEDLLAVQVELGETIARGLALKLVPGTARMAGATRPEVYEAYLRARHHLGASEFEEARRELERAVGDDPGFAPAWAALAETYRVLAPGAGTRSLAKDALARALALDDELPEAHFSLAMMRVYEDYDFEGAREAFERAIELNPGYAEAYHNFAAYFSITGRHDDAIAAVQHARRLDPFSTIVSSDVGWYYYFARRYDEAIEISLRTLALDPDFYWAKLCIQLAYLQRPDWQGAVEQARREMTRAGARPELLARLSASDRATALGTYWRWRLERLEASRLKNFVPPAAFAQVHMAIGERALALDELESSFESRTGWILPFLAVDPLFDPLRADPRFRDLVARIGSAPSSRASAGTNGAFRR